MTVSEVSLVISLFAVFISVVALLWNVWQKFIFVKPNLQVSFGVYNVVERVSPDLAQPSGQRLLNMTVTNMGPGPVILYACVGRTRAHWWTKPKFALLNPIHGDPTAQQPIGIGPFGSGLPVKIEPGEIKSFYFPFTRECLLGEGFERVGINDTYQRNTWCRRSDMQKVNKSYREKFSLT
jgi:hypothetical protein